MFLEYGFDLIRWSLILALTSFILFLGGRILNFSSLEKKHQTAMKLELQNDDMEGKWVSD